MDLISTCPLRVASIIWRRRPDAWMFTVVCKATFALTPHASRLADIQEEPALHDRHLRGEATTSLHAAGDLAPFKPRAEVILVGSAFAPQRRPARSVVTRLNVGEVDKRIHVWCDRVFWQDTRILEAQPFAQMPLNYERAAGGPATSNPVGMSFSAAPDAYGSVPIPNLQPADQHVARRGDTFAPIAYGPLAASWPGRAEKLVHHAAAWSHRAWNAAPLPGDIDLAYFNSAPRDQQMEGIQPGERILLENLHPDHPLLVTRLPSLVPQALVQSGGRTRERIALVCDTLWIDTDRGVATLVWRGCLALSSPDEAGTILISMEDRSAASPVVSSPAAALAPQSAAPVARQPAGDDGEGGTMRLDRAGVEALLAGRTLGAELPFKRAPAPLAGVQSTALADVEPGPHEETGTVYGVSLPEREALPFASNAANAAAVLSPSAPLASSDVSVEGETLRLGRDEVEALLAGRTGGAKLPFTPARGPVAASQSSPRIHAEPTPSRSEETGTLYGVRSPAREILPFASLAAMEAPEHVKGGQATPFPESSPRSTPERTPLVPAAAEVSQRPMLEAPAREINAPAPAPALPAPPFADPVASPDEATPQARLRVIQQAIWKGDAPLQQILAAHGLTELEWRAMKRAISRKTSPGQ